MFWRISFDFYVLLNLFNGDVQEGPLCLYHVSVCIESWIGLWVFFFDEKGLWNFQLSIACLDKFWGDCKTFLDIKKFDSWVRTGTSFSLLEFIINTNYSSFIWHDIGYSFLMKEGYGICSYLLHVWTNFQEIVRHF